MGEEKETFLFSKLEVELLELIVKFKSTKLSQPFSFVKILLYNPVSSQSITATLGSH